jgi:CheY-like chemotaxis protein
MSQAHALLIDDNRKNLRVLRQLLTKQGVTSTDVLNASDLDRILSTLDSVDVIFVDLEMPELDGYSVKDMLRASHLAGAPIIAYTVHTSEISHTRQLGFDGFLGKPLDSVRFPNQLARILKGEPVWERA